MTINFIICGLEHSGTTVVSDIFRQYPGCDSGFECGVLLCDNHRDFASFQPFAENILSGWGITKKQLEITCASNSIGDFYDSLYKNSSLPGISSAHIRFDKTPRYIIDLRSIREKVDVPTLAVTKDLRSTVASDFKRSKLDITQFDEWYADYLPKKTKYLSRVYEGYEYSLTASRSKLIRLEDLCFNSMQTMKNMFDTVNLEPKIEYFIFKNHRTHHTLGQSLNQRAGLGLLELPEILRDRIKEDFKEFELMFYDFSFG